MNARHMKILSGPNKGGNVPLPESGEVLIGTDDACDLVLCDPTVVARHALLSLNGAARLKPVEGAILAGGQPLTDDGVEVEDFQVYVLGDTWLCLGPAEGGWPASFLEGVSKPVSAAASAQASGVEGCGGFASTNATPVAMPVAATAISEETALRLGGRLPAFPLKGKTLFFVASALALFGLALWFQQSSPKPDEAFRQVQSMLDRGAYPGVRLERDGDGRPVLRGWLDAEQQGAALEKTARQLLPSLVLELRFTRTLADNLSSRAKELGYSLRVIPERAGFARIRGYVKDEAVLERLQQALEPELQAFAGLAWEMKTWSAVSDTLARLAAARQMDFLRFEPGDATIAVHGIENATPGSWQIFLGELGDMIRMPIAFVKREGGVEEPSTLPLPEARAEWDAPLPVREASAMEDLCGKLSRNPARQNSLLYEGGRTEFPEGSLLPGGYRVLHILPHGVFLTRNATVYYCQ